MEKKYCSYDEFIKMIRRYELTKYKLKRNRINKPNTRARHELNRIYNEEIKTVDLVLENISSKDRLFAELLRERYIGKKTISQFGDSKSIYLCPRQITRLYPKKSWKNKYDEILGNDI